MTAPLFDCNRMIKLWVLHNLAMNRIETGNKAKLAVHAGGTSVHENPFERRPQLGPAGFGEI